MQTQTFTIKDLFTAEVYHPIFTLSPILLPDGKELWFLSGATQEASHFLPEGNSWDYDSYKIGGIFTNPHDDGTTHLFAVESLEVGTVGEG